MSPREVIPSARARLLWRGALITVIAGLYAAVGVASSGIAVLAGVLGAVAILGAVGLVITTRPRPAAVVLLVMGVLPLAILTWTSLVTPILAGLGLGLGWRFGGDASRPRPGVDSGADAVAGGTR